MSGKFASGQFVEKSHESLKQNSFEGIGSLGTAENLTDDTSFYPMSPVHMSLYYFNLPEIDIE